MEAPGCQAAAASASGTAAGEVAAGLLAGGAAGEPAGCDLRLKFWSSSRSCTICTFYRATTSTIVQPAGGRAGRVGQAR